MRILLTGGGTGGHLFPIIAVAKKIKELSPKTKMLFLGPSSTAFEKNHQGSLSNYQIKSKTIVSGKIRRYFSLMNIFDFFKIIFGLAQSLWHVFWFMPDIVFSKGGYGSVPVVLAARLYRIPVTIHESDSLPGLANRFMARFAKNIFISFEKTKGFFPNEKTIPTGNPVRKELLGIDKKQGNAFFGLGLNKPTIFIIGGSQGAQALNDLITNSLSWLLDRYDLIHQCGQNNFSQLAQKVKSITGQELKDIQNYRLIAFLSEKEMANAYGASDLIVSRAGAGSIFEIALIGKPSILIPLPGSAFEHQKENAYEYAKTGATQVLEQQNLTTQLFLKEISDLFLTPGLTEKMSQGAKSFARPQAAQKIAQEIINLL